MGAIAFVLGMMASSAWSEGIDASFTGVTGGGSGWSAATLANPTAVTASRTCPNPSSPSFKAMTTATSTTSSVTVTTPSAVVGDYLLAFVTSKGSNNAQSAGWNVVPGTNMGGRALTALYLKLTAAPAADYTFTLGDGTAGSAVVLSYSGVDTTAGFYVPYQAPTSGTGTTATSSTVTPPRAPGRMVVGLTVNTTGAFSTPSGLTSRATLALASNDASTSVWDGEITGTGATPAYTSTWAGSQNWIMQPVYLMAPAPTGGSSVVTVSWAAATAPSEGYSVGRSDGQTFTVAGGSSVSYTDNSNTAGTAYTYTVKNTVGSWASSGASASVAACP